MIKKLLADAVNGFSPNDLPFLVIQLAASALIGLILRAYWTKVPLKTEGIWLTNYLLPLQVVFTLLAIFAQRSPWVALVFGLCLLALIGRGDQLSLRSRLFFILSIIAAWGIGSGNLVVTLLVYLVVVWPFVHIRSSHGE